MPEYIPKLNLSPAWPESVGHMLDLGASGAVHGHADDVHPIGISCLAVPVDPSAGHAGYFPLLGRGHGLQWTAEGVTKPRLYFDEGDHGPKTSDQIDLQPTHPEAMSQDPPSTLDQKTTSDDFSLPPPPVPRIFPFGWI